MARVKVTLFMQGRLKLRHSHSPVLSGGVRGVRYVLCRAGVGTAGQNVHSEVRKSALDLQKVFDCEVSVLSS